MKRVVSVSLGNAGRNHTARLELGGTTVEMERRGSDGDLERARQWIADLDGRVDAIGLGGIDRWLILDGQRWEIADAARLAAAAQRTPVVDGSGIKNTFERRVIEGLVEEREIRTDQPVLLLSALDRFGMAETFYRLGFPTVAGDMMFGAGIDYPIRSREELVEIGRKLLPQFTRMPFQMLYPTGEEQLRPPDPRWSRYFQEAEIIAGDFHFLRRHLPEDLSGKMVITNTTTAEDVQALAARHLDRLVTTSPRLDGRTFGANVLEAAVVAVFAVSADQPEWPDLIDRLRFRWSVTRPG